MNNRMATAAAVFVTLAMVLATDSALADSGGDTMESVIWGEWIGDDEYSSIDVYSMVSISAEANMGTLTPTVEYQSR